MNREIKFRAWDKEDCVMRTVLGFSLYHGAVSVDIGNGRYLQDDSSRFYLMQYTGLEDKNGTEIYEGDILKRGDFPDEPPKYIVRFGKFTNSHDMYHEQEYIGWYVDDIFRQDEYRNPLTYIVDMLDGIVCGNIYENPELLEMV